MKRKRKGLFYNLTLPENAKKPLIDRNVKFNCRNFVFLVFVGVGLLVKNIPESIANFQENLGDLIYSITFEIVSLIILIYSNLAKKNIDRWSNTKKNFSTYLAYVSMMVLSFYTFFSWNSDPNCIISFAITAILNVTYFYVEPKIYTSVLTIFTVLIEGKLIYDGYMPTVVSFFLMAVILWYFSIYKFRMSVNDYQQNKKIMDFNSKISKELELAGRVQKNFFQTEIDEIQDFEVSIYNKALAGVSGDLYDLFIEDGKLIGLELFDISGHGLSSGLLTMLAKNIIRLEFMNGGDKYVDEIAELVDSRFREEKGNVENYMTGILMRINEFSEVELVNAGHTNPIIYKKSENRLFFLDEKKEYQSTVVGLTTIDSYYTSINFSLESGDEIILYSDGITEAVNKQREDFGTKRLLETFTQMNDLPVAEKIPALLKKVEEFTEGHPYEDDISIIILRKK